MMDDDRRSGLRRTADRPSRWRLRLKLTPLLAKVLMAAAVLVGLFLLAGAVEGMLPWSKAKKLEAARDSIEVLRTDRVASDSIDAVEAAERDSLRSQVAAAGVAIAVATEEQAALGRANHRLGLQVARLRDQQLTPVPVGCDTVANERDVIILAQALLIDTLEAQVQAQGDFIELQMRHTATLNALVANLQTDLDSTKVEVQRWMANAEAFDAASGCGFPWSLIGCPSGTVVALVGAGTALLVERLVVDHDDPIVVVTDG